MSMNSTQIVLPILSLVIFSGCTNSDQVPVYPVRGTIRLEGKNMPGGGSIAFIPVENRNGKTAGGQIGEDGRFVLTTYVTGDGSMEGYFRVVITQAVTVEPREPIPDGQPIPEGANAGAMVPPEFCIPAIYSDPSKSPLRATVEPRSNEINFDLQRNLEPVGGSAPPGVASCKPTTRCVVSQRVHQQICGRS